jgi:hypothetical protein
MERVVRIIETWYRDKCLQRKAFKNANEDVDAFDLEVIGDNPLSIRVDDFESHCYYTFNAFNLMKYFQMNANFDNPYNRKVFCLYNLRRVYKKYAENTSPLDYLILRSTNPTESVILTPSVNIKYMMERMKNIVREQQETESVLDYLVDKIESIISACFTYVVDDDIINSEFCFMLSVMNAQEKSLQLRNYTNQYFNVNRDALSKSKIDDIVRQYIVMYKNLIYTFEVDEVNTYHNIFVFIEEVLLHEVHLSYITT